MIRFILLNGYVYLMMYLQMSGKLNQYINSHYEYLAQLSMALAALLAVFQLIHWVKNSDEATDCGHHHGGEKPFSKGVAYLLFSLPLIVGFLFPNVTLDASIVEAKGFQFPLSNESVGDPDVETQYLMPDTSIYFEDHEYREQMLALQEKYENEAVLTVTDENYLELMEIIYRYPSLFIGKNIHLEGFVFHSPTDEATFLFRFGIIHCVADSGVFGLQLDLGDYVFENDTWLSVDGTLQVQYYQPFKRNLPLVVVDDAQVITPPKNQYVYRSF